jgi:zinc/manganese transport system substrate-binding protein
MRRLLLSLLSLAAFAAPAWAADPIRIVAAENFYGDVAAQIGGSHVVVTSILSNPDTDPHLFETSASTARTIADADITITNGAGYDAWMDRLLSAATNPNRKDIVVADLTGHKDGDNPHLWYDPQTLPDVAAIIALDLAGRDPANASDYTANLKRFVDSFAKVLKDAAEIKTSYAHTTVTATEPVFGYMATAMGLDMLNGDFQTAMMNDTEPGPSDVAAFEDSLKNHAVKILFYNSQVTDDTTARLLDLAKASNIPVVGITETEPAGMTVQTWIGGEVTAVRAALSGQQ